MPSIASFYGVGIDSVEISLSLFLLGFACGQFFGGAISDNFGRKKTSSLGLVGFAFLSFLIIFSSTIYELWVYRFFQALFGGIIVVNANATIRDLFNGQEAARVFTIVGTISMSAPLLAPAIGAGLIHFFSWKSVFYFFTIYALIIFFAVQLFIKESFIKTKKGFISSYVSVFANKNARGLIVLFPMIFSAMFIFISKSAFVYMEYFGVSSDFFPLFFGADVIFVMIMAKVNLLLMKRYKIFQIIKYAIYTQFIISIFLLIELLEPTLFMMFVLLTAHVSMLGFLFGNLNALILENFPTNAATATAVIGVLNFSVGAAIATLASLFHNGTLVPVNLGIFLLTMLAFFWVRRLSFHSF